MQLNVQTYIARDSLVHSLDARVKVALLLAFSIALFFVDTWAGLLVAAILYTCAHAASRLPLGAIAKMGVPLYVLVVIALLFGSISLNYQALQEPTEAAARMAGAFALFSPFELVGPVGINPVGFGCALFNGARVVILLYASLLVSLSTTSEDVRFAFVSFLRPLRRVKVPVDDAASALSIALRFIPQTAQELASVRNAQWARGGAFEGSGPAAALKAWTCVLIPLFVRLFRRADALAQAMDARCYSVVASGGKRTSLTEKHARPIEVVALLAGFALAFALAVFF